MKSGVSGNPIDTYSVIDSYSVFTILIKNILRQINPKNEREKYLQPTSFNPLPINIGFCFLKILSLDYYFWYAISVCHHKSGEFYLCLSGKVIKRKYKQWWSTIPPISNKTTNHLSPLNRIEYKNYHDIGNPSPGTIMLLDYTG